MTNEKRDFIIGRITSSINTHGYNVTVVQGGPDPRFAYTIGLYDKAGLELVFAGGSFFTLDEVLAVIGELARPVVSRAMPDFSREFDGLGKMLLQEIEPSWAPRMMLAALDYYGVKEIKALQIMPDREHWTIDIPNMQEPWSPAAQPIWKWLESTWDFPVSPKSKAITNLDALRGHPITELMRWEESEWEMFAGAGPDVAKFDIRMVPLGTLLGCDSTLEHVVTLKVGSGLWRGGIGDEWHPWEKGKTTS